MPTRRASPHGVKLHRSYSVSELVDCLAVHKNTVRKWQRDGLVPIDNSRPMLFHGADVKAFLGKRTVRRKCPCLPGTIYCFKCRKPSRPAEGMVEFMACNGTTGDLTALCETCGTVMHRRASIGAIAAIMPNLEVQIRQAAPRIIERPSPSLNCDKMKD